MSSYSTQTVTQLKELLKSRGLSTAGVKADLVARLEETDKINDEFDEDLKEEETKAEEPVAAVASDATGEEQETAIVASSAADVAPAVVAEGTEATATTTTEAPESASAPVEEKKTLTPEELKAAAVELLNTKLARSQKFGNEEEVKKLQADLKRIEKFGITLESPLAKSLGFVAPKQQFKSVYRGSRPNHNRNHNGFKPRHNNSNRKHFNSRN